MSVKPGEGHSREDKPEHATTGPPMAPRKSSRAATAGGTARKRRLTASESSSSSDDADLVLDARWSRRNKRHNAASAILSQFTSLDALLHDDLSEKRKREDRGLKLQQLRQESEAAGNDASAAAKTLSPMRTLMHQLARNVSTLADESCLFSTSLAATEEPFGYVFTPITEPLLYRRYKATETELQSDLKLVYETMQSMDDEELSGLLWSKAILLRCMLIGPPSTSTVTGFGISSIPLPLKIGSWLFVTMSTHSDSHVVGGCYSNLFLIQSSVQKSCIPKLSSGLPVACFSHPIEDYHSAFGTQAPSIEMEWKPSIYDFLNAFRAYGFQDSKRSMSVKSKIPVTSLSIKNAHVLPFPTLNMHYVLMYLVLCFRTRALTLEGYDAFSFTMFFLRMQFENDIHVSIVELATICIEELLEVFPRAEWRREWAPQLVLRIAGTSEGLFDSAAGWLAVARRLPRTMRGTQLTTGLAIYVLQHRIDKKTKEGVISERPLKFPIQSGLVVDIVAGIVEDLTHKYTKTRKKGKASKTAPPFDLLCKKVALMDLALQAFLNILTPKEMEIMLHKLDQLANAHKSTMSAKWHELKTLVSLMHRKYSLENLRIGRSLSSSAKTVLFCNDDDEVHRDDA